MTKKRMDSCFRRNDDGSGEAALNQDWTPAFAGVTVNRFSFPNDAKDNHSRTGFPPSLE
jgi:hypothetical protein